MTTVLAGCACQVVVYHDDSANVHVRLHQEDCSLNNPTAESARGFVENRFPCGECGKIFTSNYRLARHAASHERIRYLEERKFVCSKCRRRFKHKSAWEKHKKTHVPVSYPCRECGKRFSCKSKLVRHKASHERKRQRQREKEERLRRKEEKKFACDKCEVRFKHKYSLTKHKKVHHPELHACHKCDRKFRKTSALKCHLRTHEERVKRMFPCEECGKIFRARYYLKNHLKKHQKQKRKLELLEKATGKAFKCERCGWGFQHKTARDRHRKIHRRVKSMGNISAEFNCDQCKKSFMTLYKLLEHERVHNGIRPFECEECHKTFRIHAHLAEHRFVHKTDRNHECPECKKSFKRDAELKKHLKCHDKNRPLFECPQCDKKFTMKKNIRRHLIRHNNVRTHVCSICKFAFVFAADLKRHQKNNSCRRCKTGKTSSSNTEYVHDKACVNKVCGLCKKEFDRPSGLLRHLRAHGVTPEKDAELYKKLISAPLESNSEAGELSGNSELPLEREATVERSSLNSSSNSHPQNVTLLEASLDNSILNSSLENQFLEGNSTQSTEAPVSSDSHPQNVTLFEASSDNDILNSSLENQFLEGNSTQSTEAPVSSDSHPQNVTLFEASSDNGILNSSLDNQLLEGNSTQSTEVPVTAPTSEAISESQLLCSECGVGFASADDLQVHLVTHTRDTGISPSQFNCSTCGINFSNNDELEMHEETHSNNIGSESTRKDGHCCVDCDKRFQSDKQLRRHRVSDHHGARDFKCEVCGKAFMYKHFLEYHMASTHTEERPFTCPDCGKTFQTITQLLKHKVVHSRERQKFECKKCEVVFPVREDLREHNRTEHFDGGSTPRSYPCRKCKQVFNVREDLRKHNRTEHADGSASTYPCYRCDEVFNVRDELRSHIRTEHHVKKPSLNTYQCTVCYKSFSFDKNLRRHMVIHSGLKLFGCDHCDHSFYRKDMLDRHVKTKHSEGGSHLPERSTPRAAVRPRYAKHVTQQDEDMTNLVEEVTQYSRTPRRSRSSKKQTENAEEQSLSDASHQTLQSRRNATRNEQPLNYPGFHDYGAGGSLPAVTGFLPLLQSRNTQPTVQITGQSRNSQSHNTHLGTQGTGHQENEQNYSNTSIDRGSNDHAVNVALEELMRISREMSSESAASMIQSRERFGTGYDLNYPLDDIIQNLDYNDEEVVPFEDVHEDSSEPSSPIPKKRRRGRPKKDKSNIPAKRRKAAEAPGSKCDYCKKRFRSTKGLKFHSVIHSLMRPYTCGECNRRFSSRDYLRDHQQVHRGAKDHKCDQCGDSFYRKVNLERHHKLRHRRKFNCKVCKRRFTSREALQGHNKQSGDKVFECDQCNKSFHRNANLRRHLREMHADKQRLICSVCDKGFSRKSNLKRHLMAHSQKRPYECQRCGKSFLRKSYLEKHQKNKSCRSKQLFLKCDQCNMPFKDAVDLEKHQRWHAEGNTSHVCEDCGAKFQYKHQLTKHQAVHDKSLPLTCRECKGKFWKREKYEKHRCQPGITCDECGKSFPHATSLKRHLKVHLRPHKCTDCDKTFKTAVSLQKHRKGHKPTPYKCEECNRYFTSPSLLKLHLPVHSPVKPHRCTHCESSFKWLHDLRNHIETHTSKHTCGECFRKFSNEKEFEEHLRKHARYCDYCEKIFESRVVLVKHLAKDHQSMRTHPCDKCGKTFRRHEFLVSHQLVHSAEKPHKCECGKTFTHFTALKVHMKKTKHAKMVEPEPTPEDTSRTSEQGNQSESFGTLEEDSQAVRNDSSVEESCSGAGNIETTENRETTENADHREEGSGRLAESRDNSDGNVTAEAVANILQDLMRFSSSQSSGHIESEHGDGAHGEAGIGNREGQFRMEGGGSQGHDTMAGSAQNEEEGQNARGVLIHRRVEQEEHVDRNSQGHELQGQGAVEHSALNSSRAAGEQGLERHATQGHNAQGSEEQGRHTHRLEGEGQCMQGRDTLGATKQGHHAYRHGTELHHSYRHGTEVQDINRTHGLTPHETTEQGPSTHRNEAMEHIQSHRIEGLNPQGSVAQAHRRERAQEGDAYRRSPEGLARGTQRVPVITAQDRVVQGPTMRAYDRHETNTRERHQDVFQGHASLRHRTHDHGIDAHTAYMYGTLGTQRATYIHGSLGQHSAGYSGTLHETQVRPSHGYVNPQLGQLQGHLGQGNTGQGHTRTHGTHGNPGQAHGTRGHTNPAHGTQGDTRQAYGTRGHTMHVHGTQGETNRSHDTQGHTLYAYGTQRRGLYERVPGIHGAVLDTTPRTEAGYGSAGIIEELIVESNYLS